MKSLKSNKVFLVFVALTVLFIPAILLADDGSQHQIWQERPINLGTSGGNINDSSKLYCCGGTLLKELSGWV